eukprot:scaffold188_cov107-Isochrysis_galbana.AAC.12
MALAKSQRKTENSTDRMNVPRYRYRSDRCRCKRGMVGLTNQRKCEVGGTPPGPGRVALG